MKKLTLSYFKIFAVLFALSCGLAFLFMPNGVANAESVTVKCIMAPVSNLTSNSVAGVSSIPIRDITTSDILFYMPESYYAKVEGYNEAKKFYTVKYADMPGTFMIDETEMNAATSREVVFDNANILYPNVILQLNSDTKITIDNHEISQSDGFTLKYLGSNGSDVFVSCKKGDAHYFGLAPKTSFQSILIPYHKITQAQRDAALKPSPTPDSKGDIVINTSKTLRVLLIVGIMVPAVIIVLLLFKPSRGGGNYDKRSVQKNKKKNDYDYDRNRSYGREQDVRNRTNQNDRSRDYDRPTSNDRDRRNQSNDRYQDSDRDRNFEDHDRRDRRDIDDRDNRGGRDIDNRDRRDIDDRDNRDRR